MSNTLKSINILREEFKKLSTIALGYRIKIRDAKTQIKKDIYQKKLNKVNKKVYAILAKLTFLDNSHHTQKEQDVVNENVQ